MNDHSHNWYVVRRHSKCATAIQLWICRNWSGARGAAQGRTIRDVSSAARRPETKIGVDKMNPIASEYVHALTRRLQ